MTQFVFKPEWITEEVVDFFQSFLTKEGKEEFSRERLLQEMPNPNEWQVYPDRFGCIYTYCDDFQIEVDANNENPSFGVD